MQVLNLCITEIHKYIKKKTKTCQCADKDIYKKIMTQLCISVSVAKSQTANCHVHYNGYSSFGFVKKIFFFFTLISFFYIIDRFN